MYQRSLTMAVWWLAANMERRSLTMAVWWLAANMGASGGVHLLAVGRPLDGLAVPVVLGMAQAFALRDQVGFGAWTLATVGGFVAALIAGGLATIAITVTLTLLHWSPSPILASAPWFAAALGGAAAVAVQALVAVGDPQARPWGRRAWIVASAAGGVVLLPGLMRLARGLFRTAPPDLGDAFIGGAWAVVGALLYGAVTGYALIAATPVHGAGATVAEPSLS